MSLGLEDLIGYTTDKIMSRQPMTTVSQKLQFSDGETRRKVQFLESEETCKTLKLMKVMQQNNVINF